jgi:hypothetical protein
MFLICLIMKSQIKSNNYMIEKSIIYFRKFLILFMILHDNIKLMNIKIS